MSNVATTSDGTTPVIKNDKNIPSGGDTVAPASPPQPTPAKGWVHFDDESPKEKRKSDAAVINTESVEVNLERSISTLPENGNTSTQKTLRNVELPIATVAPIRQGFCK